MTLKAVAITGGGGGGGVSGGGTPGTLPIWSGATALGNSPLSFSGATLSSSAAMTGINFSAAAGGQTWTLPNNGFALTIQGTSGNGTLKLDTNNRYVGVDSPSTPADKLHIAESGPLAFRMQNVTAATYWQHKVDGSGNWGLAVNGGTNALSALAAKMIASLTLTAGGTLYTNGTYSQVPLTGGSGTGATADIVISGNAVIYVSLRSGGAGYLVGDVLSVAAASVGGTGSGFQTTVASVANQVQGDGELSATRIGAGTSTPTMGADVLGGGRFSSSSAYAIPNPGFGWIWTRGNVLIDSSSEPGGVCNVLDSESNVAGVFANPNFSTASRTAGGSVYGGYFRSSLSGATASGTTSVFGTAGVISLTSAIAGRTIQAVCNSANMQTSAAGAGNTITQWYLYGGTAGITTANAQAVTAAGYFVPTGASFTNAAHTVTNFYGLRLPAVTLSGGATITNNFGISQEDTTATNQFSATTNTFSGIVRATSSLATAPAFSSPTDTNTGMYFPFGDTIRFAVGGSPGVSITSTKELQFDSGYGSVATAYGTRAWVNFNGTGTVAIRASGNVSSIADGGVGKYTVNFTSAMPDVNYGFYMSSSVPQAFMLPTADGGADPTTGAVVCYTTGSTGTALDASWVTAAVIR